MTSNESSVKDEKIKNIISLLEAKQYVTLIQSYSSGTEFLDVWEWAEATGNDEVQSKISSWLASYWIIKTYKRTDKEVEQWKIRFRSLTEQEKRNNRPNISAEYLEALSILETDLEKKFNLDEDLIQLYQMARNWEMLVHTMNSIRVWHMNHQRFDKAKNLCLEMYKISSNNGFDEGIGISLNGLGDYFKDKQQRENAAACYYLSWKILRPISERMTVPREEYQKILSREDAERKFNMLTPEDLITIASKEV
jgi:hypothetical protein